MKIAIFGGSFNPIHNAHIKLAQRFVNEVKLDKVAFVPTHITPLKNNTAIVLSEHRFNMCELALKDYENFFVSDVEIKREGMSYSSDTIAYFKEQYPNDELFFIMGADMFLTLEKWHEFEYIFNNVTILTAPRDGCDYDDLMEKYNIPLENVYRHFDVTGKLCPRYMVDTVKWAEFKSRLRQRAADNIPAPYARDAVRWAKSHDIIAGNTDADLMLTKPLTRQQFMVMLYRYHQRFYK